MKTSLLIAAVLFTSSVLVAEEPKTDPDLRVSCSGHVVLKDTVIASLRAENLTLTIRVNGLFQLLNAAQREVSDAIALSAVSVEEKKILTEMGLSLDCEIQRDGTIDCETEEEEREGESDPSDSP